MINSTETVTEFTLMAFSELHQFQILLFPVILLLYITCITGNLTIISVVRAEPSLHIPMYFFIIIFSALEIMFASVTVPKLLANLLADNKEISFTGCFMQLYAFNALGETECWLLAIMVFDRHMAINNPLRYSAIMTWKFCKYLAFLPWIIGFSISFIPIIFTAALEFCGPNKMNHFFCDFAPLQNLACSNTSMSSAVGSFAAVVTVLSPFLLIMGFYTHIIFTIISKVHGSESKYKAFSTCSSHLIVSSLFYGSGMIVYIKPKGSHYDKFLALIYTVIIPVLNPFIYTLRNQNVKKALGKTLRHIVNQFPV